MNTLEVNEPHRLNRHEFMGHYLDSAGGTRLIEINGSNKEGKKTTPPIELGPRMSFEMMGLSRASVVEKIGAWV